MGNNLKVLIAGGTTAVLDRLAAKVTEIERVEVIGLAKDTPEAISLFDSQRPDAAIIDIQMPGPGGGLGVLGHIRRSRPVVTVVMVTNSPYPHYRDASVRGGAGFFFDKSNDLAGIVEVISDLARGLFNADGR